MNKKTMALSIEDYTTIIDTIQTGFEYVDETGRKHTFRANEQLAVILKTEAVLGIRIGDVLNLRLTDIVKDGKGRRLDITEEKTGKERTFAVPAQVYAMLYDFMADNNRKKSDLLFATGKDGNRKVTERAVQKSLKIVADYLGIENVSTHSFRKTFARNIYEDNGCNIELVRQALQHSSVVVSQRYIGVTSKQMTEALTNNALKLL